MSKKLFEANKFRPSNMLRKMRKHSGDVSVGSKTKVMAKRSVLGRNITFYENGLRVIEGEDDVTEEQQFNSEVLRLAHASLLINDAVGDKRMCYVDARVNPVVVYIYGMLASDFVSKAKELIKTGQIAEDFVLDSPIQELKNVRNVRLFGRRVD